MAQGRVCGLQHIGLFIKDLEVTKKFYMENLGFEIDYEFILDDPEGDIKICFLKNGDCCIEAVQFPNPEKRPDGWVDHIAFRVENIEAMREELVAKGIECEELVDCDTCYPGGSKWVMFRGPDGEHLELNEKK